MTPLHVDPQNLGPTLPDEQVEAVVRAIQQYTLIVSKGSASGAFGLLLAAIGEFADQTDAPIDLLTVAIEQLTEERDEARAAGFKPAFVLKAVDAEPEDEVTS